MNVDNELESASSLEALEDEAVSSASLDDIIKGSKYQKIPTTNKPVQTNKKSGSSSVIPIAAGLTAAAAAGIGAKAYMDYKKNNATGEDEYDEEYNDQYDDFETEEWQGDDDITVDNSSNEDNLIEFSNNDYYQEEDSGYTARENLEEF